MNHLTPIQAHGPVINRIPDLMAHISRYASRHGVERLSQDAGLSRSSVSRLIHNEGNPSFLAVARLTGALEKHLGRRIDPRDLLAEGGRFLTHFACEVSGCRGCLPEIATDEFGDLKRAFEGIRAGAWVTSRYPRGLETPEGGHDGN